MPPRSTPPGMLAMVSVALLATACSASRASAQSTAPAPSTPVVVPIRIVNNHVHLLMASGGREVPMIFDTGAGFTLLDISMAETLRFPLGQPATVGGAGNAPVRAFYLNGGTVVLPQDTTLRVSPSIAIAMSLAAYEGIPVSGILGADFTRQVVLQLDYAGSRMMLHPRSHRYEGGGSRVPLTFKDGHPHVKGQVILRDGTSLAADCVVDVGSSGALILTRNFVERHQLLTRVGPTIRRRSGRGVGGSAWATIGRVAAVRVGDIELATPITAMYGDSAGVLSTDRSFECNIGGEILRRFNVFFDYGRAEMILEPTAAVQEPFEADMGGAAFRIDATAGGLRVADVMPSGPAASVGLREGDLIVGVDGQPALTFGVEALRRRLRRHGGEVEFRVRRAEGEQVVRLPVRRLI